MASWSRDGLTNSPGFAQHRGNNPSESGRRRSLGGLPELPGRPPRSPGAAHAESIAGILLGYQGIARILLADPIKPLVNLGKNTSLVGIILLRATLDEDLS